MDNSFPLFQEHSALYFYIYSSMCTDLHPTSTYDNQDLLDTDSLES